MIAILVTLIIVGVALYLIKLIPMDNTLKHIIRIVVILFVILWLLKVGGLWSGFGPIGEPRV